MSKAGTLTYIEQIESGKITGNRVRVYFMVKDYPHIDLNRICLHTGISKINVGARLSELRKMGVITIKSIRTDNEGNYSQYVVEEDPDRIEKNRIEVKQEHFQKWLKKSVEFNEFLDLLTIEVLEYLQAPKYKI
jgi:transcription initiation factor IIE alpha subunit